MFSTNALDKVMLQLPEPFIPNAAADKYIKWLPDNNYSYAAIKSWVEESLTNIETEKFSLNAIAGSGQMTLPNGQPMSGRYRMRLEFELDPTRANWGILKDSVDINAKAAGIEAYGPGHRLRMNNLRILIMRESGMGWGMFIVKRFAIVEVTPLDLANKKFYVEIAFNAVNLEFQTYVSTGSEVAPRTTTYTAPATGGVFTYLPPTSYVRSSVSVSVNGIKQSSAAFVAGNAGITILEEAHLQPGDVVSITYDQTKQGEYSRKFLEHRATADGAQEIAMPSGFVTSTIEMFVNGMRQRSNSYLLENEKLVVVERLGVLEGDRVDLSYFAR